MYDNHIKPGATEQDLRANWKPSDEQMRVAALLLASDFTMVFCGHALPGKQYGWWEPGQQVEAAPGYWPVRRGDHDAYRAAREAADRAGGEQLAGRKGTSGWALIELRDGEPVFAVWEGMHGEQ